MKSYDVVVIGGGPGGYVAAIKAAKSGLKTALSEKESMGGVCLNWGCIPTKTLLRNAEVVSLLGQGAKFGFDFDKSSLKIDYSSAFRRSREVSDRLSKGVDFLMKKNKIDTFMGNAELKSANLVGISPSGETLEAKNIIIATGSRSSMIPGVKNDGERILNARDALSLEKLPSSAAIIGAGAIGMEFAGIWNSYGVDVTIIEMLPGLLPLEDADIGKEMARQYKSRGIKVMTGTKVESVESDSDGVSIKMNDGRESISMKFGALLVSTGVKPNSEGIGLEAAGVTTERGYIGIDDDMRTNVRNIYAIGDVTGKLALAHVASAQGIIAADSIAGLKTRPLQYHLIPRCTYCSPEAASIGYTEKQAADKGYDVKTGRFPLAANGKALAMGESAGFVKIVVDKKYDEILGVHMVGPHVTELLSGPAAVMTMEGTLEELTGSVYAHPTISEAIAEAAHNAEGMDIQI